MRDVKKYVANLIIKVIKTAAQSAVSLIAVGSVMSDINWTQVASVAAVSAIYTLLSSLAGLEPVQKGEIIIGSDGVAAVDINQVKNNDRVVELKVKNLDIPLGSKKKE